MPDIDINVNGNSNIEVELENTSAQSPEISLQTDAKVLSSIGTTPLYGPRGPKGENGRDGADGQAATVTVGTTTTGQAGTDASVVNSGTSLAAVLDFTIPKGDKGDTGATGASGQDGYSPTATVTKSGNTATITITDKNGTTTANVYDGAAGVSDVQVDNTSVVTSGVANIDLTGYAETSSLATVATSGSYNDLINTPTIPAAQVNSDWNSSSGVSEILNKPTIPTVNNSTITFTQGGVTKGSFTLNQSSGDTIALDAGGGGTVDQTYDKTSANAQSGVAILGLLETMYPVGSLYISKNSTNPLASLFGTWQLVASDKALWTGDGTNGGTTIAAGLPSIEGLYISKNGSGDGYSPFTMQSTYAPTSALYSSLVSIKIKSASQTSSTYNDMANLAFSATRSSSVYGNSTTVQPPAYVVNVWERTA